MVAESPKTFPPKVNLFVTCLVDQFVPSVGISVVNILEERGIEVHFPADQTCCGQPAFNSGFRNDARPVASRFLEVLKLRMVRSYVHQDLAWRW